MKSRIAHQTFRQDQTGAVEFSLAMKNGRTGLLKRRNFSQQQSMNGKPASDDFCSKVWNEICRLVDKYVGLGDDLFDLLKIFRVIRAC